jgi:hypothetical protein
MRILLDECVPWPLHKLLVGHACSTAQQNGWTAVKNGDLLRLAEPLFDAFITSDQNLLYQQNLQGRKLPIIVLSTNNWRRVKAGAGLIRNTLDALKPGGFVTIHLP